MQFTPKSAAQIEKEKQEKAEQFLLSKGEYDFEVVNAEHAISKTSGKDMIKLRLKVFAPDGKERYVTDYLVSSMEHKLYEFAWSAGIGEQYDAGQFEAEDCQGRCGRVKLKIEKQKGWEPKNSVSGYVVPKKGEQAASPLAQKLQNEDEDNGDSVPF